MNPLFYRTSTLVLKEWWVTPTCLSGLHFFPDIDGAVVPLGGGGDVVVQDGDEGRVCEPQLQHRVVKGNRLLFSPLQLEGVALLHSEQIAEFYDRSKLRSFTIRANCGVLRYEQIAEFYDRRHPQLKEMHIKRKIMLISQLIEGSKEKFSFY